MAARLTTHVLDTAKGCPAEGLAVTLYRIDGERRRKVGEAVTNSDGRTDAPMLEGTAAEHGVYELVFAAAGYLGEAARFLGDVPVRFTLGEDAHHHVPLLLSPYGYSTYRGS